MNRKDIVTILLILFFKISISSLSYSSEQNSKQEQILLEFREILQNQIWLKVIEAPEFKEEELKELIQKKIGMEIDDELWDITRDIDTESIQTIADVIKYYVDLKTEANFPLTDRILLSIKAEEIYPLYKIGQEISLKIRDRDAYKIVKGKYLGHKDQYVYIDHKRIYKPDIIDNSLDYIENLRNENKRNEFVNLNFDLPRSVFSQTLYNKIAEKYSKNNDKLNKFIKQLSEMENEFQKKILYSSTSLGLLTVLEHYQNLYGSEAEEKKTAVFDNIFSTLFLPNKEGQKEQKKTSLPRVDVNIPEQIGDYRLWELIFVENRKDLIGKEFTISGMLSKTVDKGKGKTLYLLGSSVIVEPNSESMCIAEDISIFFREGIKNKENKAKKYKDWLAKIMIKGKVKLADKPQTLLFEDAQIIAWYGVNISGATNKYLDFIIAKRFGNFSSNISSCKGALQVSGSVKKSGKEINIRILTLSNPNSVFKMGFDPLSILTEVHKINTIIKRKSLGSLHVSVNGVEMKQQALSIYPVYQDACITSWLPPENVNLYKLEAVNQLNLK